ncbi:MAG: SMP-30/gluconolactonase/LRE family protein [Verrucomicrobia bacterium]|nr:SMP-30/gluconolactonase/LRE family protein [Verrucomicrobiota bacterium]
MQYSQIGLPTGSVKATVAAWVAFTEGPAVDANGTVYFSDMVNNRILKLTSDGTLSVFREPSGRTNGQTFDLEGRLLHCEGAEYGPDGGRRITRTNLQSGEYEILTETFEGLRYNAPNDICVDGLGRIYFTDPCYWEASRKEMEMTVEGVYRIDLDGSVTRILKQPAIQRPNGIAVTQNAKKLYLIDSCPVPGGNRKVWDFDLDADGNPENPTVLWDFAPGRGGDGMRLDMEGNIYVAAGIKNPRHANETDEVPPGIYVFTPGGEVSGRIPIPEDAITNLSFGGDDGKTLYVTAGKTLFKTRADIPGQVAYPKWKIVG